MKTESLQLLLKRWRDAVAGSELPQPFKTSADPEIGRLIEHSGTITVGDCFIARHRRSGDGKTYSDGHPYINHAIENGATVVIAEQSADSLGLTLPDNVTYLQVSDSAIVLCWLAAAKHNFPGRELTVIGVTGTDGKTSVVNMIYAIMTAAAIPTGMISTIKAAIGDAETPTGLHVTTPQAPAVQAYLRQMVDNGLTHCILEATSMGLAEHRVDAAFFDIGVVSNITHEHLDYHGGYEQYIAAKGRLFELASQAVVLNRDDKSYGQLAALASAHQLTYGIDKSAEFTATKIQFSATDTQFAIHTPGATYPISSRLTGRFNVYNMLAAAACACALNIESAAIYRGLASMDIISGRMERIDGGQPFLVVVDFAHTPNALERAIEAARGMTEGRVIAVFGSAGRRDVAKRRMMAEVSAQSADLTILTAEDPREEPLDDILAMMADGCLAHAGVEGETFWRVPDRGHAIFKGLTLAQPADIVIVCGKGHEQSMCFGKTEYPWDDRDATRAALAAFVENRPMPDLGLPTF